MRDLALKLIVVSTILCATACSSGGGGGNNEGSSSSGGPPKPGSSSSGNLSQSCSEAQKIAGLCLFTLDLASNPELNRCIKDHAEKQQPGWYLVSQMKSLFCPTSVYNIESLNGIELLSSLEVLNMNGTAAQRGKLTSIAPLYNLSQLKELHLNYHNFETIPALSNLPLLTNLSLANNFIEDPSPVEGHQNLAQMDLSGNNLKTLGPIIELPKLSSINLTGNSNINCDEIERNAGKLGSVSKPSHCECILGSSQLNNCRI